MVGFIAAKRGLAKVGIYNHKLVGLTVTPCHLRIQKDPGKQPVIWIVLTNGRKWQKNIFTICLKKNTTD